MAKRKTTAAIAAPEPEVELDFESRVRMDFYTTKVPYGYSTEERTAYREDDNRLHQQFMTDLVAYLIENGVPEKYASKTANYAWQEGHSSGFGEVLNCTYALIDIFKD